MLIKSLNSKDVINSVDGTKLGKVIDLNIDFINGKISEIVVQENLKVSKLFTELKTFTIEWDKIVQIGEEVIIVKV